MSHSFGDFAIWLDVIAGVGGIAGWFGAVVIWLVKASLVTRRDLAEALAALGQQTDDADNRLVRIETDLQHMPTQRDFAALSERVSQLSGEIGKISVGLEGMNALLTRIERPLNMLIDQRMKESA